MIVAASTVVALTGNFCVRPACGKACPPGPIPTNNAWTESFIGTLKTERLQDGSFIDHADARIEIFAYLESHCNTHLKHSFFGYKTPASFEAQINSNN